MWSHTARRQQRSKGEVCAGAAAVGRRRREGTQSLFEGPLMVGRGAGVVLSSLGPGPMGLRGSHTSAFAFAFAARKQLYKRTIQDVLEEHNKDKDRETKRKRAREGEAPGGEGRVGGGRGVWKGRACLRGQGLGPHSLRPVSMNLNAPARPPTPPTDLY